MLIDGKRAVHGGKLYSKVEEKALLMTELKQVSDSKVRCRSNERVAKQFPMM